MRALIVLVCFLAATVAMAEVKVEHVDYAVDGVTYKGYLAYDDKRKGKRPGVLVVHEWWGHNDYARRRARMLAELGYTALALDMYGEGKQAKHPQDASRFSQEAMKNFAAAKKRFQKALGILQGHRSVRGEKVAAIGYCFGGAVVLNMARAGVDLKGVVSFHGSLGAKMPISPGSVKAKLLVLNGADDPFIKPEQIEAFQQEMKAAGVDYEFTNYAGAKHAFTNPDADAYGKQFNIPLAYSAQADRRSWARMQDFLEEVFD